MYIRNIIYYIIIVLLINILSIIPAGANNLLIENVTLENRNPTNKTVVVEFDISWDNSWRTKVNHDAAWITVRLHGTSTSPVVKKLCELKSAGINPLDSSYGSNSGIEIDVPADKKGAFIRSSAFGTNATLGSTNVRLMVDYNSCGFASTDNVVASVFGIEMVFVPEGAFYAGDFDTSSASLDEGSADPDPWYVASEAAINASNPASNGFRYVSAGNAGESATGASFSVPAAYPKGYGSFYAMKYEINEGQWVEFFNSLPNAARANRDLTNASHKNTDLVIKRNTISCSGSPLSCSTSRPYRPVGFLSWMDLAAFLDWASLRPMTELEFEKAARGPVLPRAGEYAWAEATVTAAAAISAGAENGAETVTTALANANFNSTSFSGGDSGSGAEYALGALRNGVFAGSDTDRVDSGATYYGIMEFSGNLSERTVTIGNGAGRLFVGTHGDGALSVDAGFEGNADSSDWPGIDVIPARGVTGADGSGFKGGAWNDLSGTLRISDRANAANAVTSALNNSGGRGVRTHGL